MLPVVLWPSHLTRVTFADGADARVPTRGLAFAALAFFLAAADFSALHGTLLGVPVPARHEYEPGGA